MMFTSRGTGKLLFFFFFFFFLFFSFLFFSFLFFLFLGKYGGAPVFWRTVFS